MEPVTEHTNAQLVGKMLGAVIKIDVSKNMHRQLPRLVQRDSVHTVLPFQHRADVPHHVVFDGAVRHASVLDAIHQELCVHQAHHEARISTLHQLDQEVLADQPDVEASRVLGVLAAFHRRACFVDGTDVNDVDVRSVARFSSATTCVCDAVERASMSAPYTGACWIGAA